MYKVYQYNKEMWHLQRYKLFFELLMSVVFSGDKNKTEALLQDFSLLCYFAN